MGDFNKKTKKMTFKTNKGRGFLISDYIKEEINLSHNYNRGIENLETIDLFFVYNLYLPSFYLEKDFKKMQIEANKSGAQIGSHIKNFNLEKKGFHIEPAYPNLKLTWLIAYEGNQIRLIGKKLKKRRRPKNDLYFKDPGNIFIYYGYKIIRPYHIVDPDQYDEQNKKLIIEAPKNYILID